MNNEPIESLVLCRLTETPSLNKLIELRNSGLLVWKSEFIKPFSLSRDFDEIRIMNDIYRGVIYLVTGRK